MEYDINQIWKDHRGRLYKYVFKRVRNKDTAEDIVHNVFVKAFEKIETLKNPGKIQNWLFRIAGNSIADYYRSLKKEAELPDEIYLPDHDPGFKAEKELSECLMPMIDNLPPRYRESMILSEIEGLTHREISASLGISVSGSKSRIRRGRILLKQMLTDCCLIEFDKFGNINEYFENKSFSDKCGNN